MLEVRPTADDVLDVGETSCGDLIMLIATKMKRLQHAQILHVVGHDPGAREDIPAWCRMTHNALVYVELATESKQPSHFYLQKG